MNDPRNFYRKPPPSQLIKPNERATVATGPVPGAMMATMFAPRPQMPQSTVGMVETPLHAARGPAGMYPAVLAQADPYGDMGPQVTAARLPYMSNPTTIPSGPTAHMHQSPFGYLPNVAVAPMGAVQQWPHVDPSNAQFVYAYMANPYSVAGTHVPAPGFAGASFAVPGVSGQLQHQYHDPRAGFVTPMTAMVNSANPLIPTASASSLVNSSPVHEPPRASKKAESPVGKTKPRLSSNDSASAASNGDASSQQVVTKNAKRNDDYGSESSVSGTRVSDYQDDDDDSASSSSSVPRRIQTLSKGRSRASNNSVNSQRRNRQQDDSSEDSNRRDRKRRRRTARNQQDCNGDSRLQITFSSFGSITPFSGALAPPRVGKKGYVPHGLAGTFAMYAERWCFKVEYDSVANDNDDRPVTCIRWSIRNHNWKDYISQVETVHQAMKRETMGFTLCNSLFRAAMDRRAREFEEQYNAEIAKQDCDRSQASSLQSRAEFLRPPKISEGPLLFGLRHKVVQDAHREALAQLVPSSNNSSTTTIATAISTAGHDKATSRE